MSEYESLPSTSSASTSQQQQVSVKKKVCYICRRDWDYEVMLGDFFSFGPLNFHYFCLLSAHSIPQRFSVIKEILGYKFEDIIECSSKFEFDQCFICQKLRAGVKCAVEGCIHRWHYPCGYDSCVTIFDGDFRSYCKSHIPESFKAIQFENSIQPCLACYEEIGKFNPVLTIISSCCSKTENFKTKFLHKKCLMQYTRNAGFDSMCILCDEYDKKVWQKEMKNKGIYIPGQAAIWELDGSFDDQVKQKCTHPDCDIKNNRDVFTCYICGTEPRHLKCVGAETHSQYLCSKCYGENFVKIVIPDKFPKE